MKALFIVYLFVLVLFAPAKANEGDLQETSLDEDVAFADRLIYASSNLSGHRVAPEWLGGDKPTGCDVGIRSLKAHGEVESNPMQHHVYVNAIGYRQFLERFPSGKPLQLGRYRYEATVQLPILPKPDVAQKVNPQAIHTMIQFWDGRNALYQSDKSTLEGAIYWELNPWAAGEFGKIKVYTYPITLVDTGIRLPPDTQWHRFVLAVDLVSKRYVSITIDDETRDLSHLRLAQVRHPEWGAEVAFTITTESLAAWSKEGKDSFKWTTRFRTIRLLQKQPLVKAGEQIRSSWKSFLVPTLKKQIHKPTPTPTPNDIGRCLPERYFGGPFQGRNDFRRRYLTLDLFHYGGALE